LQNETKKRYNRYFEENSSFVVTSSRTYYLYSLHLELCVRKWSLAQLHIRFCASFNILRTAIRI